MEKFGRSQPVKRVEDVRLVSGRGGYVDDITPAGALFAYLLRSPVAHATITTLNLEEARAAEGVHLVAGIDDLKAAGLTEGLSATLVATRDGGKGANPRYPLLAEGKLRFVGEAVALIVAESLTAARDAAEMIELDYDDLEVEVVPGSGNADLHDDVPGNRGVDYVLGDDAALQEALAGSAHVVRTEVTDNRVMVVAMEPRGCFAEWDGARMHLSFGGQGVWGPRTELARLLDLPVEDVRVTHPDVGGGFGMKAKLYPEYALCAFAARALGRPVRWIADRTESMLSDNGARDLVHEVAMGFDEDMKITGYHVKTRYNLGAFNSNFGQIIQSHLFARVLTGVYDIKTALLEAEGYYTNTTPTDAYRGAGRPEAIYLLERTMDYAARALNVDPWDLRRKNFIAADAFPYRTVSGELYDVGDFNGLLDKVAISADRDGFAARRAESEAAGKLRGLGLCYYIESILGDPSETAKVEFNADGTVNIYVGTQSNGQGHETVYARFLADQTGIPMEMIRVIQGDSDRIATGGGTGGSRSVTTQSNATLAVVKTLVEVFTGFVAEKMGVKVEDVSFDDESFRIKGSNAAPTMLDVADMAREAGRLELLVQEEKATLPGRSYPNGAHVAEVEVDPETGGVTLERYTVVDDFGNMINPVLAEGQVHGGVVQGVGQAFMENVTYDEDGQLLTASFMDYAMPRASDVPMIGFDTAPVPSTANPMGMKGCGEAGTVGSMAAAANAVMDALATRGVGRADMPFTPARVWALLQEADRENADRAA
ncbi:xanthine dehydrogenase family protein molybdopterin-binding subunit [Pseudooceanicola sediminis]|mgnify:FL=1|uniref:Xanthine dehydrogenase family protein molybdopterin-binding subunit n=1 Tax=Pseudooceanicola sediminis TaxID=2211117 RepID=A0A399IXS6_9RHOB|nr:xanthine dehydrogenase family protein molybdopterin-binding subunit [Pseudooceanicola sediminis]KAA2313195.1 xanthine dehydrogenase family protein [Puniceibacterium sp. HSS470]RII37841.1 xanthine dehydrogenase family protein molybdopterin-binding subunit [Pseudooceanicola sediminis]|tara:strand:+ start:58446 stop:60755 length:2310 start_codon:yes stop_codon:yes gene_type:complete